MIMILLLTIENHFGYIGHVHSHHHQTTTLQYYTHRRVHIFQDGITYSHIVQHSSVRNWDFFSLARGTVALNNLM